MKEEINKSVEEFKKSAYIFFTPIVYLNVFQRAVNILNKKQLGTMQLVGTVVGLLMLLANYLISLGTSSISVIMAIVLFNLLIGFIVLTKSVKFGEAKIANISGKLNKIELSDIKKYEKGFDPQLKRFLK